MNPTIFTWKYADSWRGTNIYLEGQLYGNLAGFYDNKVSRINGKLFFIEHLKENIFTRRTYITDPNDKKAYCEVYTHGLYSPAFKYDFLANIFFFTERIYKLSRGGNLVVELKFDKWWFTPDTGTIEVYTDENVELLLYAIFYFDLMQWQSHG